MLHFKLLLYLSLVIAYGLEPLDAPFQTVAVSITIIAMVSLDAPFTVAVSLVIAYGLEPLDAPFQTVAVFITSHCIWFRDWMLHFKLLLYLSLDCIWFRAIGCSISNCCCIYH